MEILYEKLLWAPCPVFCMWFQKRGPYWHSVEILVKSSQGPQLSADPPNESLGRREQSYMIFPKQDSAQNIDYLFKYRNKSKYPLVLYILIFFWLAWEDLFFCIRWLGLWDSYKKLLLPGWCFNHEMELLSPTERRQVFFWTAHRGLFCCVGYEPS